MFRLPALVLALCLPLAGMAVISSAQAQEGTSIPSNGTFEDRLMGAADDGRTIKLERAGTLTSSKGGATNVVGKIQTGLVKRGQWVRVFMGNDQVDDLEG